MNEFEKRVESIDPSALYATHIEVIQLNIGLQCNMACSHCHQMCSPHRTEVMSDQVIKASLAAIDNIRPNRVDITGGSPELHPHIRELVASIRRQGIEVIMRTNLTVLIEPDCRDLPELWASHNVKLFASLPSWDPQRTDSQRGNGTFASNIQVLRRLNDLGYGTTERLRLDIVTTNQDIDDLPADPKTFESHFRNELADRYDIRFHSLRLITAVPLGRFRQKLQAAGRLRDYTTMLRNAFNRQTVRHLACRKTILIRWDGGLYDCDFNLGAGLGVLGERRSVSKLDESLATRRIAFGPHCFSCTANAGSS